MQDDGPKTDAEFVTALQSDEVPTIIDEAMLPETIADRYKVLRRIGHGGMGIVYLAQDTKLNRYVAIKRLLAHSSKSQQIQRRFLREAQTIASLAHFHIVSIYDIGQEDEDYYISMEYVAGPEILAESAESPPVPVNLEQLVKIKGVMPLDQAKVLMIKVCSALEYAHNQGIIHRDIKPSNILLDAKYEPKLVDFGLARPVEKSPNDEITQHGTLLGTPEYVAPEQWSNAADVDTRADIFSLGAVFWYVITGELPRYFRESVLDAEIAGPLAKALSYKRDSRYDKIEAFAAEIKATMAAPAEGGSTASAASQIAEKLGADEWRCANCHKTNPDEAAYCTHCGAYGMSVCPMCEGTVRINVQYCPHCGADIEMTTKSQDILTTARGHADFLEFETAIEVVKDLAENHSEAQSLNKKWREIVLKRRNLLIEFDSALQVHNTEKAVEIAQDLTSICPVECLSDSADFDVAVRYNTLVADLQQKLGEAAERARDDHDLAALEHCIRNLNRVFGEDACTQINKDLRQTRANLDNVVTQAGLILGMNCFSHALQVLETMPPWEGTELGDRRTRMYEHCQERIGARESAIDAIESSLGSGEYSEALLQITGMGRFRLPPNNSEVRPSNDDLQAHRRILEIDKVLIAKIEEKIPSWIADDEWNTVINAMKALGEGSSSSWRHLADKLTKDVNREVARRYNLARELEGKSRYVGAGKAWDSFLKIPEELSLPDLWLYAKDSEKRHRNYIRMRRDRFARRTALLLLVLWLYPAGKAFVPAMHAILNAGGHLDRLAWTVGPGLVNLVVFVVGIFVVRGKRVARRDRKRLPSLDSSPQLNALGFLAVISPLSFSLYRLTELLAPLVGQLRSTLLPPLVVAGAWVIVDLLRQRSFKLPAAFAMTISWLPVAAGVALVSSFGQPRISLWPLVALVHGLAYCAVLGIDYLLARNQARRSGAADPAADQTADRTADQTQF